MATPRTIALHHPQDRQLLLIFLIAVSLFLSPAVLRDANAAIPFSTGDSVTVTTDVLNVRATPGTDGAIVDRLYEGEAVTICAVDGWASGYEWVQVSRVPGNPIGWVAAEYLGYPGRAPPARSRLGIAC